MTDARFSGECATHFGVIINQYPPQVSSRSSAAAWGCHVHNEVNKSLDKEIFDCANIGDFYDCGCAEDEDTSATSKEAATKEASSEKPEVDSKSKARLTGSKAS